jgi:hypothetical protein
MMSGKIFCSSIFASWGWYLLGVPQEVTPFFRLTQNIVHYQLSFKEIGDFAKAIFEEETIPDW